MTDPEDFYAISTRVYLVPVTVRSRDNLCMVIDWKAPELKDIEKHMYADGLGFDWLSEQIDNLIAECEDPNGSKSYADIHKVLLNIQRRLETIR